MKGSLRRSRDDIGRMILIELEVEEILHVEGAPAIAALRLTMVLSH